MATGSQTEQGVVRIPLGTWNIARARYGFDGPMRTLHEVGDELDVSAERVRQIQERALEKLRLACSSVLSDSSRSRVDQSRPEQERVMRET